MKGKCKSCASCGMEMEKKADFALGDTTQDYCVYCTDEKGRLLPFEAILKMNAEQFESSQGITREAAVAMARDVLRKQPAWKNAAV